MPVPVPSLLTVSVCCAVGCSVTVTMVAQVAVPPWPETVAMYVVLVVGDTARDPLIIGLIAPTPLLMEPLVAFALVQERVVEPPEVIVGWLTERLQIGCPPVTIGCTVTLQHDASARCPLVVTAITDAPTEPAVLYVRDQKLVAPVAAVPPNVSAQEYDVAPETPLTVARHVTVSPVLIEAGFGVQETESVGGGAVTVTLPHDASARCPVVVTAITDAPTEPALLYVRIHVFVAPVAAVPPTVSAHENVAAPFTPLTVARQVTVSPV